MPEPTLDLSSQDPDWWRQAVVYQVYPRSFADADGDGIGDLPGITQRLPHLGTLGVDALWLSPFYPSALADGGYDVADYRDVDPRLGTLDDFDALVAEAHRARHQGHRRHRPQPHLRPARLVRGGAALGARLRRPATATSSATAGARTANCRPPTGSRSSAAARGDGWRRTGADGQWYLHLFAPEQPDLNWANEEVREDFLTTLRFWSDRGVDGFRVDVAHALAKDLDRAAARPRRPGAQRRAGPRRLATAPTRFYDRDEVHEIYRDWREVFDEYDPPRMAVAEAWVPGARRALYARPDGLGQAFNFGTCKPAGTRRSCARSSPTTSQRPAGRAPRRPGCCPTTTSSATPPASALPAGHRPRRLAAADGTRPAARRGGGPAPGPGGDAADAGAAGLVVPLPGRGAGPARGRRPARRRRSRTRSGCGRPDTRRAATAAGCRCRGRRRARRTASARAAPGCRSRRASRRTPSRPRTGPRARPWSSTARPCACAASLLDGEELTWAPESAPGVLDLHARRRLALRDEPVGHPGRTAARGRPVDQRTAGAGRTPGSRHHGLARKPTTGRERLTPPWDWATECRRCPAAG